MKGLFCVVILALIAVIASQRYSKRDGCRATALLLCNDGNSGGMNGGMNPGMNGGMYPGMNGMNGGMNGMNGGMNGMNGGMNGMNGGMNGMNGGMNGGMYPGSTSLGRNFLACCIAMCGDDCLD